MFWKWGGKDIKIYGNGVIEGQGFVNIALSKVYLLGLTTAGNAGGTNLSLAQAR